MVSQYAKWLVLLLGLWMSQANYANAQSNPFWKDQPLPPKFRLVTVEPNTGKATLNWEAPDPSPNNPVPHGYLVYREELNSAGQKIFNLIQTLTPGTFSWVDDNANAQNGVVRYKMASQGADENKNSPLTDPHATIFLEVEYVPCKDLIRMKWTPYFGWNNKISNYVVRAGELQAWSALGELATLGSNQYTYEFAAGQNKTWYIYIEARRENSTDITRSNLREVVTRKQYIPSTLIIDSIISYPKHNRITLKMKLNTPPAYFRLVRQNVFNEAEGKLDQKEILTFTDPTTRVLIDNMDPEQIQGKKRFYSIIAMDECNAEVDHSAKNNSIIVRVATRGRKNIVSWDPLHIETGNRAEYRVHRIIHKSTGTEDKELATISGSTPLEITDDLTEFEGQGIENNFCYQVTAYEIGSDNSVKRVSIAAPRCAQVESKIEIPTAIAPMETAATENRLKRYVFEPLTTYHVEYIMYIYNRNGELIFLGHSEGWNGKLRDGSYAPEGAYIYRIEFRSEERGSQVRRGSFMVVYPTR